MSPDARIPVAACLLAALAMSACVTERVEPRRGMPVFAQGVARPSTVADTRSIVLPEGPIAQPAGNTSVSLVRVAVQPLGTVAYDGQTLPIVSRDGRFLASQSGEAPSWDALLAKSSALAPDAATTITALDLSTAPATAIPWPQPLPAGLILGRDADASGFLVEAIQPDGARWIGRVAWASGRLAWLVQSPGLAAHGVLLRDGSLLYVRRGTDGSADLVIQPDRADAKPSERRGRDGAYAYPVASVDGGFAYAAFVSGSGIELHAIRLDPAPDGTPTLGPVVARRRIVTDTDPVIVAQMMAHAVGDDRSLAFFHPGLARAAAFEVGAAEIRPLAPESFAAIPAVGEPAGWYASTPEALVFVPEAARAGIARIIAGSSVPRAFRGSDAAADAASNPSEGSESKVARPASPSMVLLGPVKGQPDRIDVLRLFVGHGGDASLPLP